MITFEEVEAVAFALYRHRHDLAEEWHREPEWLKQEHRRDARVAIMTLDTFRAAQAGVEAAADPGALRIVSGEVAAGEGEAHPEPRLPPAMGLPGA